MNRPRMTKQQIAALEVIQEKLFKMIDGEGVADGVQVTEKQRIYMTSWITPQLKALINHGKDGEDLPKWVSS